jgi:isoquinoline 1-oxidoreductase alpha subunit
MAISLSVNGQTHQFDGDPSMPVLWYVRDILGLQGTKFGCGTGLCGACTVHVDGQATRGCLLTVEAAAGKKITTIEGLSEDGNHEVQKAWRAQNVPQCGYCQAGQIMSAASWIKHQVPQCGYCQAGQIMSAAALLADNPKPTADQIDEAMAGNICRCGCYQRIHEAVAMAAVEVSRKGG